MQTRELPLRVADVHNCTNRKYGVRSLLMPAGYDGHRPIQTTQPIAERLLPPVMEILRALIYSYLLPESLPVLMSGVVD